MQIRGGFLELTKEMTEKQMIAYVRKIAKDFMLNDSKIEKYGVWAEDNSNDDLPFHITVSGIKKATLTSWPMILLSKSS